MSIFSLSNGAATYKSANLVDYGNTLPFEPTLSARGLNTVRKPSRMQPGPVVPAPHQRSAVAGLRENLVNKYTSRAPRTTSEMVGALDRAQAFDPQVAGDLKEIELGVSRGSRPGERLPSHYRTQANAAGAVRPAGFRRGSISLGDSQAGTFLHEFGHARDHHYNPSLLHSKPTTPTNLQQALQPHLLVQNHWPSEASATNQATQMNGGVRDPRLLAGNGTYFELGSGAKQSPRALRNDVRLRIAGGMARSAGQLAALNRVGLRKDTLNGPERQLYSRLDAAARARMDQRLGAVGMLSNPVLAPRLQQNSRAYTPDPRAIRAIDQHFGSGAGAEAYGVEEAVRQRNLAREHPQLLRARNLFGVSDAPESAARVLPETLRSVSGAGSQGVRALLSNAAKMIRRK